MKTVALPFGHETLEIRLPAHTDILAMRPTAALSDPGAAIRQAMADPLGSEPLERIVARKLAENPRATAVVVISDNTRPVPYRGESGILWPVVETLLEQGVAAQRILILVATGTHRALCRDELEKMLDPRIWEAGIAVKNHDCQDTDNLAFLGHTARGSEVLINREYIDSDIRILTGLVESHFMAGASGGRKSVCPGLVGEKSTYVFHGAPMLASPMARDLVLDGNPCHDEALEVAKKAGVDFIINVTLDNGFRVTGVFAGDLETAHRAAVESVRCHVEIPVSRDYDIVVTHAGFVGINHYQAAKVGVASIPVLKSGAHLVIAANNTDANPIGSPLYRTALHLLKLMGPDRFNRLIQSPDWVFIPEQWQAQMWARLFSRIPMENLVYYSPQLTMDDYAILPGCNGNLELDPADWTPAPAGPGTVRKVLEKTVARLVAQAGKAPERIALAWLADGPYGIPVRKE